MSRYLWADLKSAKLAKKVKADTKYRSPINVSNEIWSWNTSRAIENIEAMLGVEGPSYNIDTNKITDSITEIPVKNLMPIVDVTKSLIAKYDEIDTIIRLYAVDEDKASDYWYYDFTGYAMPEDFDVDDLSKYNDIKDPVIAETVRMADMKFYAEKRDEQRKKNFNFLNEVAKICMTAGDYSNIFECVTNSVDEFIAFITLASTVKTIIDAGGINEVIRFSVG